MRIFRWGSNYYFKVSDSNFVRQKKYSHGCKGIFVTCSFLLLRRSLLPVLIKSTFNTFSTVLPDQAAQISGPFSNIRMILPHNFVSQLEDNVTTHPFSSCFAGLSVPVVFHRDAPVPLLPSRNHVQFRNQCLPFVVKEEPDRVLERRTMIQCLLAHMMGVTKAEDHSRSDVAFRNACQLDFYPVVHMNSSIQEDSRPRYDRAPRTGRCTRCGKTNRRGRAADKMLHFS